MFISNILTTCHLSVLLIDSYDLLSNESNILYSVRVEVIVQYVLYIISERQRVLQVQPIQRLRAWWQTPLLYYDASTVRAVQLNTPNQPQQHKRPLSEQKLTNNNEIYYILYSSDCAYTSRTYIHRRSKELLSKPFGCPSPFSLFALESNTVRFRVQYTTN